MKHPSLAFKFITMAILFAFFMGGLYLLTGIISARQQNANQVINTIAKENVTAQTIIEPYIIIPHNLSNKIEILTPTSSSWKQNLQADNKTYNVNIYRAITYTNQLDIMGQFELPDRLKSDTSLALDRARLYVNISDLRGVKDQPTVTLNGVQKYALNFYNQADNINNTFSGLTANVPLNPQSTSTISFKLTATITGMQSLQMIPLAKHSTVALSSNWQNPSFYGASHPSKTPQAKGFNVKWDSNFVATQNRELLTQCLIANDETACTTFNNQIKTGANAYGVHFLDAVNVYLMTERTLKYAFLFLVVTFGCFFLFETLKGLNIHPIQYALVGAALAVFYLLLLSFSEHSSFMLSYIGSSIACVSLIVLYLSAVLKSTARALVFGSLLLAMYAALYVIIFSEDFTLILGSVFLFILLAIVMLVTRHVDWYALSTPKQSLKDHINNQNL